MAYAKRSLKKKTTKKRSSMKRKAPKANVTSRGRKQAESSHRQTGYVRALLDPMTGPLVGVPQFVPIDTHRVRTRAIGTINVPANSTTDETGSCRIFFNPSRMVANDTKPIRYATQTGVGAFNDAGATDSLDTNVTYASGDFLAPGTVGSTGITVSDLSEITNGDGIKARVVGAMIRVCNVSSVNTRGGVFTALHEPHHKTLENFSLSDLSKNSKAIIRPCGDGGYVSLLYRPVKPEEVEDWQITPWALPGQVHHWTGDLDGTVMDSYPGYMAIDYQGPGNATLHVEAYAIVEYAGESLTTLVRAIGLGGGKPASPDDARKGAKDAGAKEDQQGKPTPMNVDAAFETPPPSPTVAGGEVEMQQVERQLASIKRAVASNAREIRKNRSGIQRSKEKARIAGAVNAYMKKTPRKRVYSFKSTPRASSRRRY